jgi:hypothetical protein
MRKGSGVFLMLFILLLAFGVYGAVDSTTTGLPPTPDGQIDPFIRNLWIIYLIGSIFFPISLWFSNYYYTKTDSMGCLGNILAVVTGMSFMFGIWFWAGLFGQIGLWPGVVAGVVAFIANLVIAFTSEGKALNDQYKDYTQDNN